MKIPLLNKTQLVGILSMAVLAVSCTEDPFLTDLSHTPLVPADTVTSQLQFKTYQVPPEVGFLTRLYVGERNGFKAVYSLLKLGDIALLGDSLVALDSAYLQLTIDASRSDTTGNAGHFFLSYMNLDSNYSESSTNFTNDDWVSPGSDQIQSTVVQDSVDTSKVLYRVRFDIDTSLVTTLADTSLPEKLFILEPFDASLVHVFYSSESSENYPFMEVFYHYRDTMADTSVKVPVTSDVSIIEPPFLNQAPFDQRFSYLSTGGGFRTVLVSNIDSLGIPAEAVIIRANLILISAKKKSDVSSAGDFWVSLYGLDEVGDSIVVDSLNWSEFFQDDPYTEVTFFGRFSVKDSILTLDAKPIVQSIVLGNSDNLGFKLTNYSSASIFDYVAFYTGSGEGATKPMLEVLYEVP